MKMVRHKSAPESQGLVLVNASQINCACRARWRSRPAPGARFPRSKRLFGDERARPSKSMSMHTAPATAYDSLLKEETHNPTHNEKNRALSRPPRPPEIPTVTPPISRPIE